MSTPYKVLARFYNNLIEDESYLEYAKRIVGVVKANTKSNSGIDCACGSGIITRHLKRAGFNVLGVDISEEMLKNAQEISLKEGLNINYLKQDIKSLKSFEKVGFITCINDGLNYILQKDVSKTLKSFSKNLIKGGLLVFDVSTESKFKNLLNGKTYADNSESLSYVWFSDYNEEKRELSHTLTFFEKQGEVYKRYDEEQTQYAHSVDFIESELKNAGFKIISVTNESGLPLKNEHH
ncbi:MAG: class I SAM-dependent methyltransferase, partial [Clostridia bacterium]|nr:class I SAM-dependent methyltransferase [Clostridia bacterium]